MELKGNRQRAKWAIFSLMVFGVVMFLMVISSFMYHGFLDKLSKGKIDEGTSAEAYSNYIRHTVVSIAYLVFFILAAIRFIMWFRRAYFNLRIISPESVVYEVGWAAGSWFIPLLNLVRPYQIMMEIWYETYFNIGDERKDNRAIIGWWWGLFVAIGFYSNLTSLFGDNATYSGLMIQVANVSISVLLLFIPLYLIIKIIQQLSKAEETLRERYHTLDITRHLVDDNTTKAY